MRRPRRPAAPRRGTRREVGRRRLPRQTHPPYDNWVRGACDTTKTGDAHPIPMTPQLATTLQRLRERGHATGDEDYVFATNQQPDKPSDDKSLREAFQAARQAAGLKPIRMDNLRHPFGTTLAANNINVRTIQALMRHTRITTTEQYLAYQPQPHEAHVQEFEKRRITTTTTD